MWTFGSPNYWLIFKKSIVVLPAEQNLSILLSVTSTWEGVPQDIPNS